MTTKAHAQSNERRQRRNKKVVHRRLGTSLVHDYSSRCDTCVTYLQARFKHLLASGEEGLGVIVMGIMDVKVVDHSKESVSGEEIIGIQDERENMQKIQENKFD